MALLIYAIVAVPVLYFLYWLVKPLWDSARLTPATDYDHTYVEPSALTKNGVLRHAFPSLLEDAPSVYMSLIVPAYEEEKRLPGMLKETIMWLQEKQQKNASYTWEIIVVDDGSRDRTTDVALEFSGKYGTQLIRVMRLAKNQGKGGAVQQGMLHARGQYLLMVDADAATQIGDLDRLEAAVIESQRDGAGLAVGSRAHLQDDAVAKRKWYRNILMYGFHFLVSILCVQGVKDTQCGFKLFSRKVAKHIFVTQHLRRWSFDVELLYVAQALRFPIREVAVNWTEIPGSKLSIVSASINMARDMFIIRLAYTLRIWRIRDPNTVRRRV